MERTLIAVFVAFVSVGGVWLRSSLQAKNAKEGRAAIRLQEHNDRAGETLGQLRLVIAALKPDSLSGDWPDSRRGNRFIALHRETQALRTQLSVLSDGHPAASVRTALTSLSRDVNAALGDAGYMVSLLEQSEAREARGEPRTTATKSWTKARDSLDAAIALIHETLN